MRFLSDGPIIPDTLLRERDAGRVVFVCGAGVSILAGMPTFVELTRLVIEDVSPPVDGDIIKALRHWTDDDNGIPAGARTPLDQIFNMLQQEYGRDLIGQLVTKHIKVSDPTKVRTTEHEIIAKISSDRSGTTQIVTTNFDHLFEFAAGGDKLQRHEPPTFPDLRHDVPIVGITYLHGRLPDKNKTSNDYVLSSADFGRAYLAQGWATSFIRLLLSKYTVVLLGYQAEDPPVKYLLQGLNSERERGRRQLYAFDQGQPDDIETKWKDRGVTPIPYGDDHCALWDTLDRWANRSSNPEAWRSSIIALAQRGPNVLQPHERGMVCHLVQTTPGAKLFAEVDPPPPAEWLCVFDRNCRFEKAILREASGEESFHPTKMHGLDDDQPWIRDKLRERNALPKDLISWCRGDDSPESVFGLVGASPEGHEPLPTRLLHISHWIAVNVDDPVLAWWVARQIGLHPRLRAMLAANVDDKDSLPDSARKLWWILLEWLDAPTDHAGMQWFRVRRRVQKDGWSSAILRRVQQASEPVFRIKPPLGKTRTQPPSGGWNDVQWNELAYIEVEFVDLREDQLNIPDEFLPGVFAAVQWNLHRGVQRLNECNGRWHHSLTLYPENDIDEDDDVLLSADAYVLYFVSLLNRMAQTNPAILRSHIDTWPHPEPNIFDKLRLYTLNHPTLYSQEEVIADVLSLNRATLWNSTHRRELLFLLKDRWSSFPVHKRSQVEARILEGRSKFPHEDVNDFEIRRVTESAIIIGWLVQQGCQMCETTLKEWSELTLRLPNWQENWAEGAARSLRGKSGMVVTDENATALDGVPLSELTTHALAETGHAVGEFIEHQPFRGLVKHQPFRAISALGAASRRGGVPTGLWGDAIGHWPQNTPPKLNRLFCERMRRLTPEVIVQVRYEIGRWLEDGWVALVEEDEGYALKLFDELVSGLLSAGEDGTESGLGGISIGGVQIERSRRTIDHAINSPIGSATRGLSAALAKRKLKQGHGMPLEYSSRFARLIVATGEGSNHAICILSQQVNWLDYIAPGWVKEKMIPWFKMGHPACEPAWNGLLSQSEFPVCSVFEQVKESFNHLFPEIYSWNWGEYTERKAHAWVVSACVLSSKESAGISFDEARGCIRNMKSRGHVQVIQFLGRVGRENDKGWTKYTIPFVENAWPKEKRFHTEKTTGAWVSVLERAGDGFPDLLGAVRAYLRPTSSMRFGLLTLTRREDDEVSIATEYPQQALDLVDLVVPDSPDDAPYNLAEVLSVLTEAKPKIVSDQRFARLETLAASQ